MKRYGGYRWSVADYARMARWYHTQQAGLDSVYNDPQLPLL